MLDGCEVVLDEWPWLEPMIEIEGPSEESVKTAAALLGCEWDDAIFGTVVTAYRTQYPALKSDMDFVNILNQSMHSMQVEA